MSVVERNFANYELGDDPRLLANGLLLEIGHATGFAWTAEPNEQELRGLVGHIGPEKWLQANIELVQRYLGTEQDAKNVAANWVDRSGALQPLYRSFVSPEITPPTEFDDAYITGGVARWMLRRVAERRKLEEVSGVRIGRTLLVVGNAEMKETEHGYVASMARKNGKLPTQAEFAGETLVPMLKKSGIENAEVVLVESGKGSEIAGVAAETSKGAGKVLAIANAPAAIQVAGEFRLAARALDMNFDATGEQMFMAADGGIVARGRESLATHQNPFAALGQLARNGLYLQKNAA